MKGLVHGGLYTIEDVRVFLRMRFGNRTHEEIATETGLSAGFVGMVLAGTRDPSKSILDVLGMERVVLFRKKVE